MCQGITLPKPPTVLCFPLAFMLCLILLGSLLLCMCPVYSMSGPLMPIAHTVVLLLSAWDHTPSAMEVEVSSTPVISVQVLCMPWDP